MFKFYMLGLVIYLIGIGEMYFLLKRKNNPCLVGLIGGTIAFLAVTIFAEWFIN